MKGRFSTTEIGIFVALLILLVGKFLLPDWLAFLVTVSMARGLAVLGLLMLWRTGLVSFGQAFYFGIGGYTAGLLQVYAGVTDIVLLTVLGTLFSGVMAYLLGLLICRFREIFFAMICMAFSMILYGILVKSETLGSTDGFNVVGLTVFGMPLKADALHTFVYVWVVVVACLGGLIVNRYLASPMGSLTTAIKDNEIRVEYLGTSVRKAINVKFTIAGALAGAGGVITAVTVGHIDPDAMVYWTVSGEFVFVTILSGTASVAAPFIGSIIFELLRTYAFVYVPQYWQFAMGLVLLLIIFFLPGGL